MTTNQDKLRDAIEALVMNAMREPISMNLRKTTDQLLALFEQREAALFKAVGEKVIGEDVSTRINYKGQLVKGIDNEGEAINTEKAEQRKALAKLQEGEK